mgnify:CR=1 FL=1
MFTVLTLAAVIVTAEVLLITFAVITDLVGVLYLVKVLALAVASDAASDIVRDVADSIEAT